jgi:RNA polymerase sigma-70 factor (family 1)
MCDEEIKELLVNIALNDDKLSFKKLYLHFYRRLLDLACLITKNPQAAEEIVDDVFTKIWLKRDGLTHINNFTVYAYVAIKNHSLNHLNKAKKVNTTNIEEVSLEFADASPSAEARIITAQLAANINQSIQLLPTQCKLAFKLVKEDGLKYKEVARVSNISVKTVEYHIANALKKIAQNLPQNAKETLVAEGKSHHLN